MHTIPLVQLHRVDQVLRVHRKNSPLEAQVGHRNLEVQVNQRIPFAQVAHYSLSVREVLVRPVDPPVPLVLVLHGRPEIHYITLGLCELPTQFLRSTTRIILEDRFKKIRRMFSSVAVA